MRIVFYAAQVGKPWNGATLYEESLGGSETAVVYLARELARRHHEVFVFTRAAPGIYDDVVYLDWGRARGLLATLPLDVLVCSRDAMPLVWGHHAQTTAIWMHDLPAQGGQYPPASVYMCVGQWQAGIYASHAILPKEKLRVVPNGVDMSVVPALPPIRPLMPGSDVRLAWTSNPERGLWHAAELLHRVRKDFPKAKLHVWGRNSVYGWTSSHEANFFPHDMSGVVLHDSLPKAGLYAELARAHIWAYPTWWPETYCIAGVEAQACGVPVVSSYFGALSETCTAGAFIEGSMRDGPTHVENMAGAVLDILHSTERREAMREAGRKYAATQTWKASADAFLAAVTHTGQKAT